jgi:hypothetical protein
LKKLRAEIAVEVATNCGRARQNIRFADAANDHRRGVEWAKDAPEGHRGSLPAPGGALQRSAVFQPP